MTPQEEAQFRARLDQQTQDDYVRGPSPAKDAAFRARLAANDAPVPTTGTESDPHADDFVTRTKASLGRLYNNPAIRGMARMADPSGATSAAAYGAEKLMSPDVRQPTSFTREAEGGPQHVDLAPMASNDLTMPSAPTLAQQARARAPGGGFGGVGGSSLGGLAADYKNAQLNQVGTFDRERDLAERRGELQGERINKMSDMQEIDAARKTRAAEVEAQHQAQVTQKHEAFLARNQELADQIGNEKIDPGKIMANKSLGEKISLTIAGALSGFAGQGPQFMQRMDNMISEGVKAQMANVDNQKAKLSARQTLFGQMMAESGDRRTAEMQTRQLMWDAVNQKMKADAERLGIPEVTNNAELMSNDIIEKKLDPLRVQMTGAALQAAKAQAAANAAAQSAAEHLAWQRSMDVAHLGLEKDKLTLEREKLDAENGVNAGGLGKAGRQALALEGAKAQQELDGHLKAVDNAMKDVKAITSQGSLDAAYAAAPGILPGVNASRQASIPREAYNRQVMISVGAAYKLGTDATEPKRKEMLEHFAEPYTIVPSDSEKTATAKMAGLKKLLSEGAGAKGAAAPELPSSLKFDK